MLHLSSMMSWPILCCYSIIRKIKKHDEKSLIWLIVLRATCPRSKHLLKLWWKSCTPQLSRRLHKSWWTKCTRDISLFKQRHFFHNLLIHYSRCLSSWEWINLFTGVYCLWSPSCYPCPHSYNRNCFSNRWTLRGIFKPQYTAPLFRREHYLIQK